MYKCYWFFETNWQIEVRQGPQEWHMVWAAKSSRPIHSIRQLNIRNLMHRWWARLLKYQSEIGNMKIPGFYSTYWSVQQDHWQNTVYTSPHRFWTENVHEARNTRVSCFVSSTNKTNRLNSGRLTADRPGQANHTKCSYVDNFKTNFEGQKEIRKWQSNEMRMLEIQLPRLLIKTN